LVDLLIEERIERRLVVVALFGGAVGIALAAGVLVALVG
jgi:uncharacterized membrane protein YsdA (DUF1294 family)